MPQLANNGINTIFHSKTFYIRFWHKQIFSKHVFFFLLKVLEIICLV